MKAIEPVSVTDALLISSSVAETDYAEWSIGTTYAAGARVIKAATHRIYESAIAGNVGNDPASAGSATWIDIGPTNRWAMFDPALGTLTSATGSIDVTLAPGAVDSVALLEVEATTVRVRVMEGAATLYDALRDATDEVLTFLELPASSTARVVVTIAGSGTVKVGVLLVGAMLDLGETEAGPSVGINDFSRRQTDDFGATTVVSRGWAKTMTLRSKIDTADVDTIQRTVARMRAKPALWIGDDDFAALTIYGFFKSFSIDLALETISYCSFTIEGLAA